ncbi:MAG: HTH domain-containing protein [Clostridiales bacterium]|nr:HTH domain-containing protein [Clostridiales bacterium]
MIDTCVCCGVYVPEGFMICPGCLKYEPKIPANKKDAILEYLRKYHCGRRNAVHSKELQEIFKLDDRAVRRKISALRQEGHPICSGDMGYYYAESQKEINSTVNRLNDLVTGVANARTGLLYAQVMEPVMTVKVTLNMAGGDA